MNKRVFANDTSGSVTFDNYEAWTKYNNTPAAMVGAAYVYRTQR